MPAERDRSARAQPEGDARPRLLDDLRSFLSSGDAMPSQFSIGVLWNVASLAVLGVAGIIINVIIAGTRGAGALGLFNQVYAVYIFLSQIAVGGVQFSVLKHISHAGSELRQSATIALSGLLVVTPLSALVSGLALAGCEPWGRLVGSPGVAAGLGLAIPGLLFFSLNKVLLSVLNGRREMRAFAAFQVVRYLLILAIVVTIIVVGGPGSLLPLSLSLAELLLFLSLVVYLGPGFFLQAARRELGQWMGEHLRFGARGALSGVCSELNTRVDVLMLGLFCSDARVGVYSFASTLAEGFVLLSYVVRNNVDPILGQYFAGKQRQALEAFSRRVINAVYLLVGVLGAALIIGFPVLLLVLDLDPSFQASWLVLAILTTGIVLSSGFRALQGALLQGGRPGLQTLLIATLLLSNVVLNALLIPLLEIYGAALATGLVFVLEAVLLVTLVRRALGIRLWSSGQHVGTVGTEKPAS